MTGQTEETVRAAQGARQAARRRPLAGFLIAGASLAALFGIAALKGRVKDKTERERGQ